jgi:GLPGLI family protein
MKNLLNTLVLLLISLCNAQHNYVLVDYTLDNYGFVNNETLLANQKNSKHANESFIDEKTDDEEIKKSENDNYVIMKSSKQLKIETFQTIGSPFIYQIQNKEKQHNVFIKDSLPNFNWKIESNAKKVILGFDCVKASCRFRGTDIVAYFAEKIPIPFGPWKFGKLPGLILEVYTENTEIYYHWKAVRVKYPYESKTDLNLSKEQLENSITQKIYIQNQDVINSEKNKILNSRTSNGVRTASSKTIRGGIEKIYEWEE